MSCSCFKVTPERLTSDAKKLNDKNREFRNEYKRLYQRISDLKRDWGGDAEKATYSRIKASEAYYNRLFDLVARYADFLNQAARKYQQTEADVTNLASRL